LDCSLQRSYFVLNGNVKWRLPHELYVGDTLDVSSAHINRGILAVFIENNIPQHTYIRVPLQNNIIACLCISILLNRSIFNQESLHLILKIIAKLEQIRNKMNLK
jgi:hypothetical protein